MSFHRLIFYSAVIGGWAALIGWLIGELVFLRRGGANEVGFAATILTSAFVGAVIAGGLNLLAGAANGQWKRQLPRALAGAGGGLIAGALGGLVGEAIYHLYAASITRALGWMVMGTAIGSVEGIYDRSPKKLRNGLIGGAVGGFLGGLLFDPIRSLVASNLPASVTVNMSIRATTFVILGLFVGLFIGLAQVILKEAWLTVMAGFRPG